MLTRPVLLLAGLAAVYALAGCGGGGGSSSDPASVAPPESALFVEATLRPEGALKSNVEGLSRDVAGIADPGQEILSRLESALSESDAGISYAKDIQPWLGEKGAIFFRHYDGDDFSGVGFAVQSTDEEAAQGLIDKLARTGDEPIEDASYEGVDYKFKAADGSALGLVGDFLVFGEDEAAFKAAVDAADGESLADVERYSAAVADVPGGSLADVYADIGGLIKQAGDAVDPQAELFLKTVGVDPSEATATASLVPGSDRVEIDIRSDLTGENPPSGDAADFLGSLPAESLAAFAAPEFGQGLSEAIDSIDADGIPGEIPPHQLKSAMKKVGLDLDRIAGSIGDLGVFVEGSSRSNLDGAVVLTTESPSEATNTVSNVGLLLRASGTPGVTALGGKASGFSIRSPELGPKPIVVAAEGKRIAIGYGLPAALLGLSESGPALSGVATYKEAVSALGGTPITAFVDGPAALRLAESFVPAHETGFQEAKPYLAKVGFIAVGGAATDERTTAKLIVGFKK